MRYTKPAVLSCVLANKSVMGVSKAIPLADNNMGGNPQFATAAAYEADE